MPRGSYMLGGDTQKFRLGNEGDNGIELGIGKTADIGNGKKLGFMYMPVVWGGNYATARGFVAMSGGWKKHMERGIGYSHETRKRPDRRP